MRTRSVESRHYAKPGTFFRFYSNWALHTYLLPLLKYTLLRMTLISVAFKSPSQPLLIYWWNPDVVPSNTPYPNFWVPGPTVPFKNGLKASWTGFFLASFLHFWQKICAFNPFFHGTVPPLPVSNMKNWCR